tara:strand:+ start:103 stop:318 length:216 start_codon:yes stop_codon:yes gene_type:complete
VQNPEKIGYNIIEDKERSSSVMENEYPVVLAYDCPTTDTEVVVVCTTKVRLEEELERMFKRCGLEVAYSID